MDEIGNLVEGTLASIIGGLLIIAISWLANLGYRKASSLFLSTVLPTYMSRAATNVIAVVGLLCLHLIAPDGSVLPAAILLIVFLAIYNLFPLYKLDRVGVKSADLHVATGADYKASLDLCQHSFDFLGVGASKLTSLPEFEAMVRRCSRPSRAIRLLLSRPDNPMLEIAATRERTDPKEKKRNMISSLQTISDLKRREDYNIQVRFYPNREEIHDQKFRLLFVDSKLCLMSFRSWTSPDPTQLPQLHVGTSFGQPQSQTFLYPLTEFFELNWELGEPWNFIDFLE